MGIKTAILAFLVFSQLVLASCPEGSSKFFVPAVIGGGNGGEISQVFVQVKNGSGKVYTSIAPKVDQTTQFSQEIASFVGFRSANKSQAECDVFFWIGGGPGIASVNGLSAGTGMALGVIGALGGRSIRQDLAITGAIEPDGSIGSVGGLFEKAQAAKADNLTYLLVPKRDFFDSLFWGALNASVRMVEAGDISEAAKIAFSQGEINASASRLDAGKVPENISRNTVAVDSEGLGGLAQEMNGRLGEGLSGKNFSGEISDYFGGRKRNSDLLFEKGYYYSAANEAFLGLVDLGFVSGARGKIDAKKEMEKIRGCIESLKTRDLKLTADNWELVVGSRLRESWAEKKILDAQNQSPETVEEQNYFYREALYAKEWCLIAQGMAEKAQKAGVAGGKDEFEEKINDFLGEKGGDWVDEGQFRDMAWGMLGRAKEGGSGDSDAVWRAENAEALYGQGSYLASIFDSVYSYSMADARKGAAGKGRRDVQEMVEGMLSQEYSGMWAGAYAAHAGYLYEADREGNAMPAYYTLRFAGELEKAERGINENIAGAKKENGKKKNGGLQFSFDPLAAGMFLALAFSIAALLYAIFLILKKK